jgi:hypothetical protein
MSIWHCGLLAGRSRPVTQAAECRARTIVSPVELLERDGALATLAEARDAAARGDGRVVFVVGEPGIGKTSLVARFLEDLDAGARALLGTCDDLSIPQPLPGSVSRPRRKRLAGARRGALRRRGAA